MLIRVLLAGSDVLIMSGGEAEPVGGTSCASPIVAGTLSCVFRLSFTVSPFLTGFVYQVWLLFSTTTP